MSEFETWFKTSGWPEKHKIACQDAWECCTGSEEHIHDLEVQVVRLQKNLQQIIKMRDDLAAWAMSKSREDLVKAKQEANKAHDITKLKIHMARLILCEAKETYDEAIETYDEAYKAYDKADKAYDEADKALKKFDKEQGDE